MDSMTAMLKITLLPPVFLKHNQTETKLSSNDEMRFDTALQSDIEAHHMPGLITLITSTMTMNIGTKVKIKATGISGSCSVNIGAQLNNLFRIDSLAVAAD